MPNSLATISWASFLECPSARDRLDAVVDVLGFAHAQHLLWLVDGSCGEQKGRSPSARREAVHRLMLPSARSGAGLRPA